MDQTLRLNQEEETLRAADVILKIIKNEGTITDEIEDPSEFQPAYIKLLELNIIKIREDKYGPGENFNAAFALGTKGFLRKREQQSVQKNSGLKMITEAFLATTGYLYHERRRKQHS